MSHLDQHALVESCIGVSGCEHNAGIPSPWNNIQFKVWQMFVQWRCRLLGD